MGRVSLADRAIGVALESKSDHNQPGEVGRCLARTDVQPPLVSFVGVLR